VDPTAPDDELPSYFCPDAIYFASVMHDALREAGGDHEDFTLLWASAIVMAWRLQRFPYLQRLELYDKAVGLAHVNAFEFDD
jgi:hypothetical protein